VGNEHLKAVRRTRALAAALVALGLALVVACVAGLWGLWPALGVAGASVIIYGMFMIDIPEEKA
jgi:hypothetical protein